MNKGFVVKGTLVSYTADDAATPANEGTVTITVTKANKHARVSGELADADSDPLPGESVHRADHRRVQGHAVRVRGRRDPRRG